MKSESYARLSCRVSIKIKDRAERAAAILGQSITDFTESALSDKAQEVLDNHERILLSERDFAAFVSSLENPKPPTETLKKAMADFKRSSFAKTGE